MLIYQLADRLKKAVQEKQVNAIFCEYLKGFKIYSYAFTYYSGHVKTGRKLQYHYVSAALQSWHLHYLEQNYADIDRTLEKNHLTELPMFWDVHEQLTLAKNKRERKLRNES